MPTDQPVPTLAEVVHRAAEVADPAGEDEAVSRLLERYEDRDQPVTGMRDVEEELAEAQGALDPDGIDPALTMAAAVATYLAHRRDQIDDDRESLLRLAARAELGGDPPPAVAAWLSDQGVEI